VVIRNVDEGDGPPSLEVTFVGEREGNDVSTK
jgi:hypothetical protein